MADGRVEIDIELNEKDALSSADKKGKAVGEKSGKSFAGSFGKKLAGIGAAAGAAMGAAGVAIGKAAMEAYASFEQLSGGIDTLFKDASDAVKENAAAAFQTAGMSANQYMETVTGFSASLINALGGDTAAATDYADMAVRDMADNANKMGTSIESIQQTYSSLSRGNFAMLDNLKLGYGGTKTEMERLLADAEAVKAANGEMVDYSIDNFADMVEAIHVVQEEMGVAGATAAEAATTIEGSMNAAKAAWENWLVGVADENADLNDLTTKLVDSIIAAAKNIVPRIGIITTALVGALVSAIPDALASLSQALSNDLFKLLKTLLESVPEMAVAGIELFSGFVLGIIEALPRLITMLASSIIETGLPMLLSSVITVITGIITELPRLIWDIVDMVPELIYSIVGSLVGSVPMLVEGFVMLFTAFTQALPQIISMLTEELPQIIDTVIDVLAENVPILLAAAFQLFMAILQGLWDAAPEILGGLAELAETLFNKLKELPSRVLEIGKDIVRGLWDGINSMIDWVLDKVAGFASSVVDGIKDFLGINSPSKVVREEVGKPIGQAVYYGFEDENPMKQIEASLSRGISTLSLAAQVSGGTAYNTTMNFNQPVQTPAQFARMLRMQETHGLAGAR